jgi:hypothetical protein
MILIVTYDLKTPKDYHSLYEAIKAQGAEGKWWHYMASTWLLSTTKTPQDVADAIRPHLDQQDLLFVCELTRNYQGFLPKPAWDWLHSEVQQPSLGLFSLLGVPAGPATVPPATVPPITTLSDLLKAIPPKKP